ncbi:MAG: CotH kinase family protein, partial [bacterium]
TEALSGTHTFSFKLHILNQTAKKKIKVVLRRMECQMRSLPVVSLHIDEENGPTIQEMNHSTNHSVKCTGSLDINVPEGYQGEYTDHCDSLSDLKLDYIRGRGNSTWTELKKPYKFKLKKSTDLFGMGANKHWVLLADVFDPSRLKNRMTYYLSQKTCMEYSPQCVPVEVVMNGNYLGSYLLCEQIRIGKSRLNIDELEAKDTDSDKITGGYLIRWSPYGDEDSRNIFSTYRGLEFLHESPDFSESGNATQRRYIRKYIQKTEDALFGEDFKDDKGESYKTYLDLDSVVDYWWIQELSINGDAYLTDSTYMYKKRGGKLCFGPLWDFDYVAWCDSDDYEDPNDAAHGFNNTSSLWIDRIKEDPEFISLAKQRWGTIKAALKSITQKNGVLDTYYHDIETALVYEGEKHVGDQGESFKQGLEDLRTTITKRTNWVDNHIDQLDHLFATVTFKADGVVVDTLHVLKGRYCGDGYLTIPEIPHKEGYYATGWYTKKGELFEDYSEVYNDMTVTAKYKKGTQKTIHPKKIYFKNDDVYVNLDENRYITDYTVDPYDADTTEIKWSSSDPEIATVNSKGKVKLIDTGVVTITATLPNQSTYSYQLTIHDGTDITPQPLESVTFEKDSITLKKNEVYQNKATFSPNPYIFSYDIYFKTDRDDILTVDDNGVVTAYKAGQATVMVYDEIHDKILGSYTVTVTDPDAAKIQAAKAKKTKLKAKALKKGKVRLTYKKVKGVSGYEIVKATKTKGTYKKVATLKGASKTKYTAGKLKKGKVYYFKVRPYTVISKKKYYGQWSNIIKIKARK